MRLFRTPVALRTRLAIWYAMIHALTMFCFGVVVVSAVGSFVNNAQNTTLYERAALLRGSVQLGPGGSVRLDVPASFPIEHGTAVYLFDARGRVVGRVVGPDTVPPQPGVAQVLANGQPLLEHGPTVGTYTVPVRDAMGRPRGALQVTQSVHTVMTSLGPVALVGRILLAIPILAIIGVLAGLFLAKRALGPIDRITRTAQAIGAGTLQGRLGMARRDDEVGRLAATFDEMLDRLEHAFAQQRQFVADASHELRTPLTIVKGDLEVLLRRTRTAAEYEEVVRGVAEEITRLSRLAEDLLTLARADSGQAKIAREFLYLDAVVETAAAGTQRLGEAKGVTVKTALAQDVAVIGDPARLHQVVLNLLSNAVKYTQAGGQVSVSLEVRDGAAVLAVTDTGIGIAPEDLPRVFDRFYRTDAARNRAEGGTGLGLAIARWSAEAHGGRIEVRSRPGLGSTFTVTLPLAVLDASDHGAEAEETAVVRVGTRFQHR